MNEVIPQNQDSFTEFRNREGDHEHGTVIKYTKGAYVCGKEQKEVVVLPSAGSDLNDVILRGITS